MSKLKLTYNNIKDYLKNKLSNTERYDLEKSAMQDAFDEEAFEGLNSLRSDEFEKNLENLHEKLSIRTRKKGRVLFFKNYKIAASIAILFGLGSLLYFMKPTDSNIESPIKIVTSPDIEVEETIELEFDESKINIDLLKDSTSNDVIVSIDLDEVIEPEAETQNKRAKKVLINEPIYIQETKSESNRIVAEETISVEDIPEKSTVADKQFKTGIVTDSDGNPLPGAHIKIAGTNSEVISDFDGNFTIEATKYDSLAFDYIGFQKAIHPANDSMSIALQENTDSLDEVVVVGYGTQKKTTVVGSVTEIKSSSINYIASIPPKETMDEFKIWIVDKLNKDVFTVNKKYTIQISFTIDVDGVLSNVKFSGFEKKKIKNEIKSVLLKSPSWKPATNDGIKVSEKRKLTLEILIQ